MKIDKNYNEILQKVLNEGVWYDDPNRKNVKRLEIPSYTFRHSFSDGFPAISTKKLAWKSVVTELIWFLKGDTNIKYLVDNGCNIWNKDCANYYNKKYNLNISVDNLINHIRLGATNDGDLGKVYGHYWRNFDGVDQITELINNMIHKPMNSELIVSARNPSHKDEQALPCCHYGFQIVMKPLTQLERKEIFNERYPNKTLNDFASKGMEVQSIHHQIDSRLNNADIPRYGFELHWNQRSCDLFLGIPFNIASYALLALILEKITGHKALAIQGDLKKVHLYDNSLKAAKEQLSRKCSEEKVRLHFAGEEVNQLIDKVVNSEVTLDQWLSKVTSRNFKLMNYTPQEPLNVEMLERDGK